MRWTLLFLVTGCLYSQAPSASVSGRVTDATGAVIPGGALKVTHVETNQTRVGLSNASGDYNVPYLPPGRYTPETDAQGFATWKHAAFGLNLDQEQRRDIRLEVGTTGQTITVAETPEALNTENGSRGDVTSNAALTEIPLNGRNYSDLSFLTGSVVPKSDSTNGQFTVNGARADNVVLTLASGLTA